MILPKWITIVIFVAILVHFVGAWVLAKRSGKSFQSAVLANALMAAGMSIVIVHEVFKDIPAWIDDSLAAIALLLFLLAGIGFLVRLKHYLKNAWLEQEKEHENKNK
ncbi:MAG TPA: hypothetical protein VKN18_13565 [Blastocatellia bacterium]|nr:hypothetical protein [Blastocatellia bacterium]